MSSTSVRDEAISGQDGHGGRARLLWIVAGVLLLAALAGGIFYAASTGFGSGAKAGGKNANLARSYRTIAKTELRAEANQAAKLVVSLREGTTVSGIPAGNQDGVDWLEITAVDGTKGFVPKTLLKELGPSTASTEIRGGTRRVVTSATVNLRETPSMSGKILGVADGGTRLVSDGTIQSEGEDWMRVPLDGQTTVFIMSRYTTADDDGGSGDGIEGNAQTAIGVRGFATQIANVQATPMSEARVVRALQLQEEVRIIGQTNSGRAWYVLRLADGSQGFAPREAIRLDPNASRWVYPDGTVAPGPNIPKGALSPVSAEQAKSNAGAVRQRSTQRNTGTASSGANVRRERPSNNRVQAKPSNDAPVAVAPSAPVAVPTPEPTAPTTAPVEVTPVPGPQ
jgi:uncharacterized protein YgiM (DUF1202 family)